MKNVNKSINISIILVLFLIVITIAFAIFRGYAYQLEQKRQLADSISVDKNISEEISVGETKCGSWIEGKTTSYDGSIPNGCNTKKPTNNTSGSSYYYCVDTSEDDTNTYSKTYYYRNCYETVDSVEVDTSGYYVTSGQCLGDFIISAYSGDKNITDDVKWTSSIGSGPGSVRIIDGYSVRICAGTVTSGPVPKKTTYTIKASLNNTSKTGSSSFYSYCKWTTITQSLREPKYVDIGCKYAAYDKFEVEFVKTCYAVEWDKPMVEVNGNCYYTQHYNRCCGSGPLPEPPEDDFACYGNTKDYVKATSVEWKLATDEVAPKNSANKYKYPQSVITKSKCKVIGQPTTCKSSPFNNNAGTIEAKGKTCEANETIKFNKDGDECVGSGDFYSINCKQTVVVDFDIGDDGKSNGYSILKGEGIKFGINVSSVRTCTGTFDAAGWKKSYNKVEEIIGIYSNKNYQSYYSNWKKELAFQLEIEDQLIALVNTYNNFDLEDSNDSDATLKMDYTANGISKSISGNFSKYVVSAGKGKYTSKTSLSLGVKGVNNPNNFTYSNEGNPRTIKLIPSKAYLNSDTGELESQTKSSVYAGNRFYTSYNIDSSKNGYNISVQVTGTGISKTGDNKYIVKDGCKLSVKDVDIIYRSIDVSNPFVDSSRKIRENWLNDKYNFTNIIKSNIWSQSPLYTIPLSSSDIAALKKSNDSSKNKNLDANVYLGTCQKDKNMQDAITKKICSYIK